ncbi:uncharacterized protein C8Q71DRAFT_108596 [Rhodofomes roseus]|uniref:Uncharacterized protein n=1 Tax=Rhodofomes roseus TaxID=34475 RepID=A0ABQ8KC70_9APHY|nr:uncharacterized protein C8Q71DRAFT_108596 [Rhodofomes roseus]KAH9835201.1 hypothetical protein C8Q71DRAFT_108596 [Rhodofomes roseus]
MQRDPEESTSKKHGWSRSLTTMVRIRCKGPNWQFLERCDYGCSFSEEGLPDCFGRWVSFADTNACQILKKRQQCFKKAGVVHAEDLAHGQVSDLRPLQVGDFGIVVGEDGSIVIAEVITIYSKTGGKNGKHAHVDNAVNIGAVSNIAVQLFEYSFNTQFRALTKATSAFQTHNFALLPSVQFLCLLRHKPHSASGPFGAITVDMHVQDLPLFRELQRSKAQIHAALKLFRKRGAKGKSAAEADEDGVVE